MKYTNNTGISLSMAVWLATDLYDHNEDVNTISVTSLIKPLKQTILSARVPPADAVTDLSGLVKAQSGTAVHTAVEEAWVNNHRKAMLAIGYPEKIIARVRINPTEQDFKDAEDHGVEIIPIYLELRSSKEVNGMTVSGKFDLVVNGTVEDVKNTSTYTYIKKSNDEAYKLQGSIYRWLNQDIVTSDHMLIQYIFTDWNAGGLKQNPNKYPPHAQMSYRVPLMTVEETDDYVSTRISALKSLWTADESQLPQCNQADLWQDDPVWKYYKNPAKTSRSTKNYDNAYEANSRMTQDGGVVIEVKGQVRACKYCNAFSVCKQKDTLILNGSLKML